MSKKETTRKKCTKCQKTRDTKREFYMSNSSKNSDGRVNICKQCLFKELEINKDTDLLESGFLKRMQDTLLELNLPYIHRVWEPIAKRTKTVSNAAFGIYLRELHLNHKGVNWNDSELLSDQQKKEEDDKKGVTSKEDLKEKYDVELDTKNEEDVLRLLGYDPFEHEVESDRYNLFNKLIDYLDETTMEDGFRLTSSISIVRTQNQIDKIDAAIASTMADSDRFAQHAGNITTLVNAKDKMLNSTMKLAQENRISLRHTTSKSTGAGTLSGIIKQLQEYGIEEAETNLFDIETAEGIRQVADLSNKSILQQLQFDENDYTEMISSQKILINECRERAEKFEEENRLLRKEIAERDKEIKERNEQ